MKKLKSIKDMCIKELDALNIPYSKKMEFKVNNRLRTTWGRCTKRRDEYIIEIAGRVLNNNVPLETAKTILIHEILHTCNNCMNHGKLWKRYATRVNNAYGYNVKRTNDEIEFRCEAQRNSMGEYKHMVECSKCGLKIYRTRETPVTKNPSKYRCGACGGKLFRRF